MTETKQEPSPAAMRAAERIWSMHGIYMSPASMESCESMVGHLAVIIENETHCGELLEACEKVRDWLLSFSVPTTSTDSERNEALSILNHAIAKVDKCSQS